MKPNSRYNISSKLKIIKATNYTNVPPKKVKMCVEELYVNFAELVNQAFTNNLFPQVMRKAVTSQFFKKKDDMIKDNYRPVSILAVFYYVFETTTPD